MLKKIYNTLLEFYGCQGWWPLQRRAGTENFDEQGYHRGQYVIPVNFRDQFEIIAGAVLTQNTSWVNVRKALYQLTANKRLTPQAVLACSQPELAALIKSSGYYNQKAKKLILIARFLLENQFTGSKSVPSRESLLQVWGIGPETADSILLYAYNVPHFVVDAYTKRIFGRLGLAESTAGYEEWQQFFHCKLTRDHVLYNEYHALIVAHGKDVCKTKPLCASCCIKKFCRFVSDKMIS